LLSDVAFISFDLVAQWTASKCQTLQSAASWWCCRNAICVCTEEIQANSYVMGNCCECAATGNCSRWCTFWNSFFHVNMHS